MYLFLIINKNQSSVSLSLRNSDDSCKFFILWPSISERRSLVAILVLLPSIVVYSSVEVITVNKE